jgi:hypothetical protein
MFVICIYLMFCEDCLKSFTKKANYERHLNSKSHVNKIMNSQKKKYVCQCGKSYCHNQSIYRHKLKCQFKKKEEEVQTQKNLNEEQRISYEKERDELRGQIALLLDKYAGPGTTNNTQNIENQNNNITIHINAFGKENLDYITDKMIIRCIDKVYSSIPCLIEKIHFDPNHPENHNIKITNKKLPYASVMGDNRKWKTVDRKDAIETMVDNGYNILDDTYREKKECLDETRQQHFEGFQYKYTDQDREVMKKLRTDVELMVMNGSLSPPSR